MQERRVAGPVSTGEARVSRHMRPGLADRAADLAYYGVGSFVSGETFQVAHDAQRDAGAGRALVGGDEIEQRGDDDLAGRLSPRSARSDLSIGLLSAIAISGFVASALAGCPRGAGWLRVAVSSTR